MEKLFTYVNEKGIRISDRYIENISHFLREKEITEIGQKYMGLDAGLGAGLKGGDSLTIPFIGNFFASFKGAIKSSKSIKTELKEKIEPRYSELIGHCNALIGEIKQSLSNGKIDLLIIIEDLDKIKMQEARSLFFEYATQITSIASNVIYSFPIGLYYDTQFIPIKGKFNESFELPMIMIKSKNGEEVEEGINAMKEIVAARMDLKLFEDKSILRDLILYSGGCLRDLFTMIKEAAENSQDEERLTISQVDKKSAYNKLKREYRNTIADHLDENGKVDINASEYYKILNRLANDPDKEMDNTIPEMHLRQNLTILGYNGERWCDVHPIVKDILKDRKPKAKPAKLA